MTSYPKLLITWAKAFNDVYCHHASLEIPYHGSSLFPPETIKIGLSIRSNNIVKSVVKSFYDNHVYFYLPCVVSQYSLAVPLNAEDIVSALELNSWSMLRSGKRAAPKSYLLALSYVLPDREEISYTFEAEHTPYMECEHRFMTMADGDYLSAEIEFSSEDPTVKFP